jgi:hypothetical protein
MSTPKAMTPREVARLFNRVSRSERQRATANPYVSASEKRLLKQMQDARRDTVLNILFSEPREGGPRRGS